MKRLFLDFLRKSKMSSNQKYLTELCQQISFKYPSISCNYQVELDRPVDTGKSLSEALIFASTNPQYDDRLFIELQLQYMKIPSSNLGRTCCVQKLFLTFRTIFVHNMFSPGLSLEFSCIEVVIQ